MRTPSPTSAPGRSGEEKGPAGIAARRAALEILLRVEHGRAYANVLLGHRVAEFDLNDRRLITRLVLGTLAWRARLNFELARLASRPLKEMDPAVLEILRMGLFQIRFLDRVPKHAAVDTAVALAHENQRTRNASGFINAVLRSATRKKPAVPERGEDETEYLAMMWSHPRWMVEKFVAMFGVANAERLMAANNEAAPTAIRLNPARGTREEIIARIMADGMEIGAPGFSPRR